MSSKVLIIGFNSREVEKLREAIDVPVFEVPEYCGDWVVRDVVERAEELRGSGDWHERKFVIMHELENEALKDVIGSVRSLNLGDVIFAATTENSLTFRLKDLLEELMEEHEYFRALRWARREARKGKGPFLDIDRVK
ncbi:hypothetical protein A3L12_07650 [Thermococcus sp. P6]|uniref:DUF3783 domain-containing protein n=1 Tax=Thermococcus sp. P6 TaxID=122420 RepID=UPI000B598B11|nr:DUF3783 domain-containing protein [Thermococcus sp. P6]ASJ11179.1 hypothetical protein A3L12_07650 [Thermococcus sp. P6]